MRTGIGASVSACALACLTACLPPSAQAADGKPNVVLILADNVGYGDLGPYGGGELRGFPTPRIDELAREGLRLTQYLVEPACTPSRAALMTGQYSIRNGLSLVLVPGTANTLPGDAFTMGDMFHAAGYATAIFGKWHLGRDPQSLPTAHGFDEFYGIPPDWSWDSATYLDTIRLTHSYGPEHEAAVAAELKIVEAAAGGPLHDVKPYTPEVRAALDDELTDKAIDFMKREHAAAKPFFVYLPFSMGHYPNLPSKAFAGKSRIGDYGDKMMEGDFHVGQVMDALKALGIDDDTILIFASDNGPQGMTVRELGNSGTPDSGFSGPFRGELGDASEGAVRTCAFVRWPGHVKPDTTSYAMFSEMDFLPTLADIVGAKLPTDRPIDGVDQSDVLFGQSALGAPRYALDLHRTGSGRPPMEAVARLLPRHPSDRRRGAAARRPRVGEQRDERVPKDLQHRDGPGRAAECRVPVPMGAGSGAQGGRRLRAHSQSPSEPARAKRHAVPGRGLRVGADGKIGGLSIAGSAGAGIARSERGRRAMSPRNRQTWRTSRGALAAAGALACVLANAPASAEDATAPLVRQMFDGRWPDEATVDRLNAESFYRNALGAYVLTLPVLNVIGLRDGSEAKFGKGYNVLPIWKDRMNARAWVPTPNCDVVYAMSYVDLKETGPLVVYAPPRTIGMFTDFNQHTLTNVGLPGPDRGAGGLYLLLPPDYAGHVPDGYFVNRSKTYDVFVFFRFLLTQGPDGPDARQAAALAEMTRVYPLSAIERERKPMQFPNASNVPVNMMYPTDFSYWEKLKAFVDYEPDEALSPETRGTLAAIGIVKGEPFAPSAAEKDALVRAVETAPKMLFAGRLAGRPDHRERIYPDRQYLNVWAGCDADFWQPHYLDVNGRAVYMQLAYSSSSAMVNDEVNSGSKYPSTYRDKDGVPLDGSHAYKLHLPAPIPAALYWAVTIYNPQDGTMPATGQPFPSRNQFDRPPTNADGSVDLYFAPEKPAGVDPKSWIGTSCA